jgi:hypothetical protein
MVARHVVLSAARGQAPWVHTEQGFVACDYFTNTAQVFVSNVTGSTSSVERSSVFQSVRGASRIFPGTISLEFSTPATGFPTGRVFVYSYEAGSGAIMLIRASLTQYIVMANNGTSGYQFQGMLDAGTQTSSFVPFEFRLNAATCEIWASGVLRMTVDSSLGASSTQQAVGVEAQCEATEVCDTPCVVRNLRFNGSPVDMCAVVPTTTGSTTAEGTTGASTGASTGFDATTGISGVALTTGMGGVTTGISGVALTTGMGGVTTTGTTGASAAITTTAKSSDAATGFFGTAVVVGLASLLLTFL